MCSTTLLSRFQLSHVAILACSLLFAPVATGAEWFVSVHGQDSAAGRSESEAFATIGRGFKALKPGDTLTILPGEYFDSITTDLSGKPEAPITIRAARPGTVLLRGDIDLRGFEPVAGKQGVFTLKVPKRVEGVIEKSTYRVLTPVISIEEVEMKLGSFFHDEETTQLYINTSNSLPPVDGTISASVTNACGIVFRGNGNIRNITVDGLGFTGFHHREYDVQHGSRTRWGLYFRNPENVTIRRCTAYLNSGGIHFLGGGQGCVVEDCKGLGNWSPVVGIGNNINGWGVSGTTFRRNLVQGFNTAPTSQHDITFYSGGNGCIMENNLAINAGLMIKGGLDDAIQRGNVVIGKHFYRKPDSTNLEAFLPRYAELAKVYADPLQMDFRLQAEAKTESVPFPNEGNVFYVSPQGNDGASGQNLQQPWKSLAHAAQKARPGDTVYVLPGVYAESLVPAQSGTPEKPIRFLRHGHGLVVLDGQAQHEVGVHLVDRQHVEIRGFTIRGFKRHAVLAEKGHSLRIQENLLTASSDDALVIQNVKDSILTHNLVHKAVGTGLKLIASPNNVVTGNLIHETSGPRFEVDSASLAGLVSDRNAFSPSTNKASLVNSAGTPLATLGDWQRLTRQDSHSLSTDPGLEPTADDAFALASNSPLLGNGPLGRAIGPFLRIADNRPVRVEKIAVRSVTSTTANLEWWLVASRSAVTLEWGTTPECLENLPLSFAIYHTASLAGLEPGKEYFFRIRTSRPGEHLRYVTSVKEEPRGSGRPAPSEVMRFRTATQAHAPRMLHVATDGDNSRDGLSKATAWRTIEHAADQARAGDTVLIHEGTYEEYIPVRSTGDAGAPLTFRAAPGETVWLTGSNRSRGMAFSIIGKNHVVLDGLRFRDFGDSAPHVVRMEGGAGHVVRRCLYDGRVTSGYTNAFLGCVDVRNLLIENCVMIRGTAEGLSMRNCADAVVRHSVFFVNSIRAITAHYDSPAPGFTLTHNIICDTLPSKTKNPLIRLGHVESLKSSHNLWFTRIGPERRVLAEAMTVAGKDVWIKKPGSRIGQPFLQAELQKQTGQDRTSIFANPGFPFLKELYPAGKDDFNNKEWLQQEMMFTNENRAFKPLDFQDFLPTNRAARAPDDRPIGLDPKAFR